MPERGGMGATRDDVIHLHKVEAGVCVCVCVCVQVFQGRCGLKQIFIDRMSKVV